MSDKVENPRLANLQDKFERALAGGAPTPVTINSYQLEKLSREARCKYALENLLAAVTDDKMLIMGPRMESALLAGAINFSRDVLKRSEE